MSDYGGGCRWPQACSISVPENRKTWTIPDKTQWLAFGGCFGIKSSDYSSTFGLSNSYWSSTPSANGFDWFADFSNGNMNPNGYGPYEDKNTRLCTIF